MKWKGANASKNCFKIHGTKDRIIPLRNRVNHIIVDGGTHFMAVDRADEISKIINRLCKKSKQL